MMCPDFCARMTGSTALVIATLPKKLVSSWRRSSSRAMSSANPATLNAGFSVAGFVESHVLGKSRHAETGVVYQHVNPAVITDDGLHRARLRVEFRDVEPAQVEPVAHAGLMRCLLKTASAFEIAHSRHYAIAVERQLDGG